MTRILDENMDADILGLSYIIPIQYISIYPIWLCGIIMQKIRILANYWDNWYNYWWWLKNADELCHRRGIYYFTWFMFQNSPSERVLSREHSSIVRRTTGDFQDPPFDSLFQTYCVWNLRVVAFLNIQVPHWEHSTRPPRASKKKCMRAAENSPGVARMLSLNVETWNLQKWNGQHKQLFKHTLT